MHSVHNGGICCCFMSIVPDVPRWQRDLIEALCKSLRGLIGCEVIFAIVSDVGILAFGFGLDLKHHSKLNH